MDDISKMRQQYLKDIVTTVDGNILDKLEYLHCKKDDVCSEVNQMITGVENQIINEIHIRIKKVLSQIEGKIHEHKEQMKWILTEYHKEITELKKNFQYRMRPESLEYIQAELLLACKKLWHSLENKHICVEIKKQMKEKNVNTD